MNAPRGLLVLGVLALTYLARTVFVPFFLALFLAILLEPFVRGLVRAKFSRAQASIVVTIAFLCVSAGTGWTIYRSISGIAGEMPVYSERIRELMSGMHSTTEKLEESTRTLGLAGPPADANIQRVQVVDKIPLWMRYLIGWVGSLYDLATVGIFVPLLLLYMLFDRNNLVESFNALAGKYCYLPKLNSDLPKIIRAFVRGNVFTGMILILGHGLVFRFIGLENWIPLAVLSGFLNLLPLIGAPLALILPIAQALIQFHNPGPFLAISLSLVGFHMVSNNVLLPYFMSSRVNVNSVSLVFGLLFWGWLWGPMGFLLAIPMTALVKTFLESNQRTFAISNLLAARPRHLIPWAEENPGGSARSNADDLEPVDVDESAIGEFQRRNNGQA